MSKVFVITGATSGIGRAAALILAEESSHLVLLGRNKGRGTELVRCVIFKRTASVRVAGNEKETIGHATRPAATAVELTMIS
jgi:NAD(P)-dependent dehydrogenase (short-subunit alcohol dehydrogenase family)